MDDNEALEIEVVQYNYGNTGDEDTSGTAFQFNLDQSVWATNIPEAYLDTALCDSKEEVALCVGCQDATQLRDSFYYYWTISGDPGTQENQFINDGRFRVAAQRCYSTSISGALGVFGEEHEPIKRLGLTASQNWVAGTNAWDLAESGDAWTFRAATDSVS